MTFLVIQKIKGNHYLYEVESQWDSERKKTIQKRRYIGKCDESGNLIQKKADKVSGRQFGPFYLRQKILSQNGIENLLVDLYGQTEGSILEAIGILASVHTMTPESFVKELPRTTIPDILKMKDRDSWNSEYFYSLIHQAYLDRNELFSVLKGNEEEAYVLWSEFDIPREDVEDILVPDNVRTNYYSHKIVQLVAIGARSYNPFCYSQYSEDQGRIRIMQEFRDKLHSLGISKTTYLLKNVPDEEITFLFKSGFNIICPVKRIGTTSKRLRKSNIREIEIDPETGEVPEYDIRTNTFQLNGMDTHALILFNRALYTKEVQRLQTRLAQLEKNLFKAEWRENILKTMCDRLGMNDLIDLLVVSKGDNGEVRYHHNTNALLDRESICGRTFFITNTDDTCERIMDLISMNGLFDYEAIRSGTVYFTSNSIFYTENDQTIYSLAEFLKLVVSMSLFQRMKKGGPHITVELLMSEINSIRLNFVNDKIYLDSLSEEQEGLFKAMGVKPPSNSFVRMISWDKSPGI